MVTVIGRLLLLNVELVEVGVRVEQQSIVSNRQWHRLKGWIHPASKALRSIQFGSHRSDSFAAVVCELHHNGSGGSLKTTTNS